MKLYQVTVKAWKVFYVEARSEDEALAHSVVEGEQDPNSHGRFNWEHDETSATEVCKEEAKSVQKNHPKMIVKDSEHEN